MSHIYRDSIYSGKTSRATSGRGEFDHVLMSHHVFTKFLQVNPACQVHVAQSTGTAYLMSHIFLQKLIQSPKFTKINQIEGFEPWDLSHVKERAKICRKLQSRASGTVWASSYGQITVLKPRIWIFAGGSRSQLRHKGDWMSCCKNVCDM